jgi:AraC-like DNA-binding protein
MDKGLEFLENIVQCFGVQMRALGEPLSDLKDCDGGLRSRLFKEHDTNRLAEFLRTMDTAVLYMTQDAYNCHYCFWKLDGGYCVIGPWIEILPAASDISEFVQRDSIPQYLRPELEQYFNNLPLIFSPMCWEAMLVTIVEHIFGNGTVSVCYPKFEFDNTENEYNPEQDSVLSVHFIEELYKNEDTLLDAIRTGNTNRALQCAAHFSYYRAPERAAEKFRSGKDYMLILNTLFRKTVQSSYVHPVHIHTLSSDFARRIEAAVKPSELNYLFDSMIRRYCALVQEHSLGKYSPVIRKVLNTVEFNLREPLSLSILAGQCHIDPSNLAHQFKRELGVSITCYINFRRLELAKTLLGSGLYIQEIAEQCGFLDVNYFTRLFKRQFGISPKEFRKQKFFPLKKSNIYVFCKKLDRGKSYYNLTTMIITVQQENPYKN